jgi:hypothetical protein
MTFNKSLVWDAAPLRGLRPTAWRYQYQGNWNVKNALQFLLVLISIILFVEETAAHTCDFPLLYATNPDGIEEKLILPDEIMKKAPQWSPDMGEPALPVANAHVAALNWSKTIGRNVRLEQINLKEHGCPHLKGYWYYEFLFKPTDNSRNVGYGCCYHVAVLMDGTIVVPRIAK